MDDSTWEAKAIKRRLDELALVDVTNTIRAHRIELVDPKGAVRLVLSAVDSDGEYSTAIEVHNCWGNLVAALSVSERVVDSADWTFYGEDEVGKPRPELRVGFNADDGQPTIEAQCGRDKVEELFGAFRRSNEKAS